MSEEIANGDGYSIGSIDALGFDPGFRKIRKGLGVTEFGVNAIVLPPGFEGGFHYHERQQELYVVIAGNVEIELGDGTSYPLSTGGLARVDAPVHRKIRNAGDDNAVYVIIGAEGGYVGRDGRMPEGETRSGPIADQ